MAKRKIVTVNDLFGGKPPTPPAATDSDPLVGTGQGKTSPLAVRVPDGMLDDIGDIAQREGVAVPDLLRFALGRFIKDYRAGTVKIDKTPALARYKITE